MGKRFQVGGAHLPLGCRKPFFEEPNIFVYLSHRSVDGVVL